jgi:hypothetical protein
MQSQPTTLPWIDSLWRDIAGNNHGQVPAYLVPSIANGYKNLPSFLRQFCFLYYHKQMSLQQVAATLNISHHLAQQRWIVSIALFRILLAAKPKNPV